MEKNMETTSSGIGLGFRVLDLRYRVWSLRLGLQGLGLQASYMGVGLRLSRLGVLDAWPRLGILATRELRWKKRL